MIDFDAMWSSDKLAMCEEPVRVEYAWLYGLADGHGCFEMNLRAISSKVSPNRAELTPDRLRYVFSELEKNGLLFCWFGPNGKRYAHWTGSDRPGRLPPASERGRYKKFAPPIPKDLLAAYEDKFKIPTASGVHPDDIPTPSRQGLGLGFGVGSGLDLDGIGVGEGEGGGAEGGTRGTPTADHSTSRHAPENQNLPSREKLKTTCPYCDEDFEDVASFANHKCTLHPKRTNTGVEACLIRARVGAR
jgi:hypothetical protein